MTKRSIRSALGVSALALGLAAALPTAASAQDSAANDANQDQKDDIVITANVAATTATRLPATAMETPFTIVTSPAELIEKTASRTLGDVMRYAATVGGSDGFGNVGELFSSRGFELDSGYNYFRDGLRYRKFGPVPLFDIARVELLRGPASVIYGALEPGGVVNIVSKKPLATPEYNFSARAGSYNYKQFTGDITGPLSGGVRYRLQGLFEDADSFRAINSSQYYGVSGQTDVDLGPNTLLSLRGSYYKDRRTGERGTVLAQDAAGNVDFAKVPRSRSFGEPWGDYNFRDINVQASLRHTVGDWELRGDLVRADQKEDRYFFFTLPFDYVVGPDGMLPRTVGTWHARLKGTLGRVELAGKFDLGPTSHRVLVGGEFESFRNTRPAALYNYTPINIYNPVYTSGPPADLGPMLFDFSFYQQQDSRSAYIQDIIDVGEHVVILAGLRYGYAKDVDPRTDTERYAKGAFTPQIGLVIRPTKHFSGYVSYTDSFKQQDGTDFAGNGFAPLQGKQIEIGAKLEAPTIKTLVTLALYHITKNNVKVADPLHPTYSTLSGEQESQGLELSVDTSPFEGFRFSLNYSYLDKAKFVVDNTYAGKNLPNVAKHTFGLWANYNFQGALSPLSVNAGVTHAGRRYGVADNSFTLPGYTLVDVGVNFDLTDNIGLSLNARNLFDQDYYAGATGKTMIMLGEPRTIMGGVRFRF